MFRILTCFRNPDVWLRRCITSLLQQTHKDWTCTLIDDGSDTEWSEHFPEGAYQDPRFSLHLNLSRQGVGYNYAKFASSKQLQTQDICITLDGDDMLSDERALERLHRFYEQHPDIWVTWGSYQLLAADGVSRGQYAAPIESSRTLRSLAWRCSHMRTIRAGLLRAILDDLKDANGQFFSAAIDMAVMFPAIELAGLSRAAFRSDITYIYNGMNPASADAEQRQLQQTNEQIIRQRSPKEELPAGTCLETVDPFTK